MARLSSSLGGPLGCAGGARFRSLVVPGGAMKSSRCKPARRCMQYSVLALDHRRGLLKRRLNLMAHSLSCVIRPSCLLTLQTTPTSKAARAGRPGVVGAANPAVPRLRGGTGSTKRAEALAEPNERAGIKCYLINGVCHQSASRILFPAGITVRGARGYDVSEALFGTYGRPRGPTGTCLSPFHKHADVTGDLLGCVETRVTRSRWLEGSHSNIDQ